MPVNKKRLCVCVCIMSLNVPTDKVHVKKKKKKKREKMLGSGSQAAGAQADVWPQSATTTSNNNNWLLKRERERENRRVTGGGGGVGPPCHVLSFCSLSAIVAHLSAAWDTWTESLQCSASAHSSRRFLRHGQRSPDGFFASRWSLVSSDPTTTSLTHTHTLSFPLPLLSLCVYVCKRESRASSSSRNSPDREKTYSKSKDIKLCGPLWFPYASSSSSSIHLFILLLLLLLLLVGRLSTTPTGWHPSGPALHQLVNQFAIAFSFCFLAAPFHSLRDVVDDDDDGLPRRIVSPLLIHRLRWWTVASSPGRQRLKDGPSSHT